MREVILDLETKKAFVETGSQNPAKLGVSFVGICKRGFDQNREDEFEGVFEEELSKLWPIMEKADRIIGFNIIGFDFPVLSAYFHGDIFSLPSLDILEEVKKNAGHRVSLNAIAKETLGVQKSGSGLDALRFYEQKEYEKLRDYCLMDVRITRDVYDYGKKNRHLRFKNKWNRVIEVPVDFSVSGDEGGSKVQMSLGV